MAKGKKTGGGSRKGSPNKITADLRAMIEGALEKAGGEAYLVQQAQEEPAAFLTLVGKCLPKDVNHSGAIGSYEAQPIPVESRDPLESPAGAATDGHPAPPH